MVININSSKSDVFRSYHLLMQFHSFLINNTEQESNQVLRSNEKVTDNEESRGDYAKCHSKDSADCLKTVEHFTGYISCFCFLVFFINKW